MQDRLVGLQPERRARDDRLNCTRPNGHRQIRPDAASTKGETWEKMHMYSLKMEHGWQRACNVHHSRILSISHLTQKEKSKRMEEQNTSTPRGLARPIEIINQCSTNSLKLTTSWSAVQNNWELFEFVFWKERRLRIPCENMSQAKSAPMFIRKQTRESENGSITKAREEQTT